MAKRDMGRYTHNIIYVNDENRNVNDIGIGIGAVKHGKYT